MRRGRGDDRREVAAYAKDTTWSAEVVDTRPGEAGRGGVEAQIIGAGAGGIRFHHRKARLQ